MYRLVYILILNHFISQVHPAIRTYSDEEQQAAIEEAATVCFTKMYMSSMNTSSAPASGHLACPIDFDGLTCWPYTEASQNATVKCPHYIHLFDSREMSTRHCTELGIWAINSKNKSEGDYFKCYEKSRTITNLNKIYSENLLSGNSSGIHSLRHVSSLVGIYTAGNSISITALIIALVLFAYFKKLLRCCRNVIHTNMFMSFILRGLFTLIQYFVISPYENSIIPSYTIDNQSLSLVLNDVQPNWQCKLGITLWMYSRLTNYAWIFIEAFYLHLLIFVLTFNDKQYKYRIIAAGWGTPFLFIVPWVIVKLSVDDYKCWLGFKNYDIRWILEAPVLLVVIVNFGFFVNFIKLLANKLNTSQINGYNQRTGRRLAKSAFVIIPLFGVHYLLFLYSDFHPNAYKNITLMWISMYADAIFTSFQGLVVAVLFCFLNAEVKGEVQKIWIRLKIRQRIFRLRRSSQRKSVSSDTAVTYTSRRHSNSNGLLNVSVTSESRAASLRRDVTIPYVIDEEQSKLLPADGRHGNTEIVVDSAI